LIEVRYDEHEEWLLFERESVTVVANFATQARRVALRTKRPTHVLLASKQPLDVSPDALTLASESVVILGA
jgi:hypothetical protein